MRSFIVEKKYDGKKINQVLLNTFNGLSLNNIYKALRKKDIKVNNIRISENTIVHFGDEVKVFISDEFLFKKVENTKIDAIYEDDYIVVFNKPSGIEVTGENSFTSSIKNNYSFIEPCHRLDRNTTGLILYAKTPDALDILLEKFRNHEIEKHYKAMVYGIPKKEKQTLNAYLFKDNKKSIVYISDVAKKGYVPISTSYSVLEKDKKNNTSILDVTLHTGKTHQIRAHLAYIGLPIIGDGKYGINKINKQFGFKTQQLCSFSLKFNFTTDAGILNYLNNFSISLK